MRIITTALLLLAFFLTAQEKVFVVVETGESESVIYKMNPNGSSPTQFFSWDGKPARGTRDHIIQIDISPSGRYIAMDSNHDRWHNYSKYNIFIVNSEGTSWRQITPYPAADGFWYSGATGTITGQVTDGGYYVAFPEVTCEGVVGTVTGDAFGNYTMTGVPPGEHKVYAWTMFMGEIVWGWNLVDVSAGYTQTCNISNTGYSDLSREHYTYPAWGSNDNTLYYYSRFITGIYKTVYPWEWDFDTVLTGSWTSSEFYGYDVRRSDGKLVYIIEEQGIYTANANGTGRTLAYADGSMGITVQGYHSNPKWSPDGTQVLFAGYLYAPPDYVGNVVAIYDFTTSSIEYWFGWGEGNFPKPLAWSPDGNYVLVRYHEGDASEAVLYKINPSDLSDYAIIYGPAKISDADWGIMVPSGIGETPDLPERSTITAYPNPFNSSVRFAFEGEGAGFAPATIEIYDISGRKIAESAPFDTRSYRAIGRDEHEFLWTPDVGTPSGVYFARVIADNGESQTARVVYLK
jgi:hypothetical protein